MKQKNKTFLGHPKPLLSLSMVELWERFSYYGMRSLLVIFMSATLNEGGLGYAKDYASAIVGIFGAALYLATLPGGWIADNYLGQKKAVFFGSCFIALGHLCIALSYFFSSLFFLGLAFIVIGTGLFKTCASVMVGMLYKKGDPRRDSGFTIFYMGINIGAFIAPLICGLLQKEYGWHFGFGAGGIGMLISLLIFYFKTMPDFKEFDEATGLEGKSYNKPVKINKNAEIIILFGVLVLLALVFLFYSGVLVFDPVSLSEQIIIVTIGCVGIYFLYFFLFSSLNTQEKKKLLVVFILFCAATIFWATFEQQATSFSLFAKDFTDMVVFGYEIPVAWIQSINPIFIILFAPIFSTMWINLEKRGKDPSSISKFTLGVLIAGIGFMVLVLTSKFLVANEGVKASIFIIALSLLFLSLGELCLSPVGLSLMSKFAPDLIKNQIMGIWFVASALGNVVAGLIGGHVKGENLQQLPNIFGLSMWLLFGMAVFLFIIKYPLYKMLKEKL